MALPYMEGVNYMRSDFLRADGSGFSIPEEFLFPILYNELTSSPTFSMCSTKVIRNMQLPRLNCRKCPRAHKLQNSCCFSGFCTPLKLCGTFYFYKAEGQMKVSNAFHYTSTLHLAGNNLCQGIRVTACQ